MEPDVKKINKQSHHERHPLCTARPSYRQGKKLTAVKVYTVNDESQHLLIRGVPALNLYRELKHLCMRYGDIKVIHQVKDYAEDEEPFTEVYHVLFAKIQSARFAKHMIDDKSFFGGVLHVCYAPELETVAETRYKLEERKREVLKRLQQYRAADLRKSSQPGQRQNDTEPLPSTSGINYHSSSSCSRYYQYSETTSGNREINYTPSTANSQSQRYHVGSHSNAVEPSSPSSANVNFSKSSQSYRNSQVPVNNPRSLAEAGIIAREFIPRATPKPKIGPHLNPSTSMHPDSEQPKEPVSVKRNTTKTDKFIPPQVKRIKFNKP